MLASDLSQPFNFGSLPLSSPTSLLLSVAAYLIAIFGTQKLMRNEKPFQLRQAFVIHNYFLSAVSLLLFALIAPRLYNIISTKGLFASLCDPVVASNSELLWLYYLNYICKFYELGDTLFLALQKKPLRFLHVYHHCLTLILCWTQLVGLPALQWVPITANLIVHVFMYLYYGLVASGHTPWWKQMITVLQIAQFVVDVIVCWWGIFMNYFSAAGCTGDVKTSWFGALLLSSYLGLFIDFYQKTYKSNPKAPSRPALQSGTLAREKAA